ncbi:MAG TPA: Uma2 family endonuclease [Labilithrix sp.]|nr:Uma2 family endonuclease [Labilithrix sp.]
MTEVERREAVNALPSELPRSAPPEGDAHRVPKERALEALREWFRKKKRGIYLSAELPIFYPGEPVFAPDVIAVLDVDPRPRQKWVVSDEQRGLDFALEIHVSGNAKKDREDNVVRYARLGIPEYFLFEPLRARLVGYRLVEGRPGVYQPIVPQEGRWASAVLGLDLAMEAGRIRFFSGSAPLPEAEELIVRLGSMIDEMVSRELHLLGDIEEEKRRADAATERAERLARRLRELGIDPDRE